MVSTVSIIESNIISQLYFKYDGKNKENSAKYKTSIKFVSFHLSQNSDASYEHEHEERNRFLMRSR